jgi:hypothetical protein
MTVDKEENINRYQSISYTYVGTIATDKKDTPRFGFHTGCNNSKT